MPRLQTAQTTGLIQTGIQENSFDRRREAEHHTTRPRSRSQSEGKSVADIARPTAPNMGDLEGDTARREIWRRSNAGTRGGAERARRCYRLDPGQSSSKAKENRQRAGGVSGRAHRRPAAISSPPRRSDHQAQIVARCQIAEEKLPQKRKPRPRAMRVAGLQTDPIGRSVKSACP